MEELVGVIQFFKNEKKSKSYPFTVQRQIVLLQIVSSESKT